MVVLKYDRTSNKKIGYRMESKIESIKVHVMLLSLYGIISHDIYISYVSWFINSSSNYAEGVILTSPTDDRVIIGTIFYLFIIYDIVI